MRLHGQLRVRHRPPKVHRMSRLHHRLQSRARDSGRREPLLGQDGREGHVSRHPPLLFSGPLQPVRRRAVRAHLPDQRALQAPRRHRRSQRRQLHRLPRLHGGVPVRSALHRSEHPHRREVQLLREPVENKLLPACVSVCPTECRIFGDLDDPTSEVSRIVQHEAFSVRKPEKGTGPKIFYLGAEDSAIRPEAASRPLMFKEGQVHLRPIGAPEEDPERPGRAARGLRRPARQALGRRHGPLPRS